MQADQVRGMLDRAMTVLATMFLHWMVTKGWLGESDAAQLLPALVIVPAIAYGWWNNRNKALLQAAASVPGTVVVTTPALALATPESKNIVSSALSQNAIAAAVTKEVAAVVASAATKP